MGPASTAGFLNRLANKTFTSRVNRTLDSITRSIVMANGGNRIGVAVSLRRVKSGRSSRIDIGRGLSCATPRHFNTEGRSCTHGAPVRMGGNNRVDLCTGRATNLFSRAGRRASIWPGSSAAVDRYSGAHLSPAGGLVSVEVVSYRVVGVAGRGRRWRRL